MIHSANPNAYGHKSKQGILAFYFLALAKAKLTMANLILPKAKTPFRRTERGF